MIGSRRGVLSVLRRPAFGFGNLAAGAALLVGGCTGPAALQQAAPDPPPEAPVVVLSEIEREIAELVNSHRRRRGLAPLQVDPTLTSLAREHSERMAWRQRSFGHGGFEARARAVLAGGGIARVSENVAMNDHAPDQVAHTALAGWRDSPPHLQNIEGGFDLTGVGVARGPPGVYYVTQMFAARAVR